MKTSLVWFNMDLRLHDNETLIQAIEQSQEIIPVYCFDEAYFKTSEFGFKRTGSFRAQFLLESLQDLDNSLRAIGSGLITVIGKPEEEIFKLAQFYKAKKVFAKREVAHQEKLTQELVEKKLWKLDCELETFSTSTLYHALDLPFSIKDIPDLFTTFRKKVEKESRIRPIFEKPISIKSPVISDLQLPRIEQLGLQKTSIDKRAAIKFRGGETEGIKRIQTYFFETRSIDKYKETRNGMVGENYSSKFSAWLALGCLSPREIYNDLKKYERFYSTNESTYWLEFELLWRDYFRFMMKKHHHKYFLQHGIQPKKSILNEHNHELLQQWIDGKTGVDFVDANMLELKLTGYMSNRGRQNVASYLCNDLKLDWRYGAAYFEQQLIDYDVCSNWGNWAYLAGVGNDPRGKRYFHIDKQANEYDQNKAFRNLWLE
jgi:deoxyribodipyrimidine photo-lyase